MHERAAEFADRARREYGFDPAVREFPEGTETAAQAADAIDCDVAQIASSIAMRADDRLVVVVTSGANRVSESKLADLLDANEAGTADADEIRTTLGWSIGGVPPFCHDENVPVFLDESLTVHDTVWAAAGTPQAVFPIFPEELRELSGATVVDVAD